MTYKNDQGTHATQTVCVCVCVCLLVKTGALTFLRSSAEIDNALLWWDGGLVVVVVGGDVISTHTGDSVERSLPALT